MGHLLEKTVSRCIANGCVSGQSLAANARLIEADAIKKNSSPKDNWDRSVVDPAGAPSDVMEYLGVLADAAFGAASDVEPKFTPRSDPSSQSAAVPEGPTPVYEKTYERVEARARAFFRNIMEKA